MYLLSQIQVMEASVNIAKAVIKVYKVEGVLEGTSAMRWAVN